MVSCVTAPISCSTMATLFLRTFARIGLRNSDQLGQLTHFGFPVSEYQDDPVRLMARFQMTDKRPALGSWGRITTHRPPRRLSKSSPRRVALERRSSRQHQGDDRSDPVFADRDRS